MKLHTYILISLCLLTALCCKPRNIDKTSELTTGTPKTEPSGNIKICGAYALYPLAQAWTSEYTRLNPGVQFTVDRQGTGIGLNALRSDECQLAMISRNLTPEESAESLLEIPMAKDAVVLIVNRSNPLINRLLTRGVDPKKLQMIFTRENLTWGDVLDTLNKEILKVYTRGDVSGAAEIWANFIWKTQADLKGTLVYGDEDMVKRIQQDRYGIGYCNLGYAYDRTSGKKLENIQVVPLDLDFDAEVDRKEQPYETIDRIHRAIWLGLYPKQLCRYLSFVVKQDMEDSLIRDFLNWSLTRGDSCVKASGYCELTHVEKRLAFHALNKIH